MKIRLNILLGIIMLGGIGYAQTASRSLSDKDFSKAFEMYQTQSYQYAQTLFVELSENAKKEEKLRKESNFYTILCAIKLDQKGADARFDAFVKNQPNEPYIKNAYLDLGDYFYAKADYQTALTYYERVPSKKAPPVDVYAFKLGYAAFVEHQYDKALHAFKQVPTTSSYYEDAQYFEGHIYYQKNEPEAAKEIFKSLQNSDKYKEKVTPYLLQTSYQTADYQAAITEGERMISSSAYQGDLEAQKLLGESYFNDQQYAKALPYLEAYAQSDNVQLTENDYYRMGFAYFQTQQYAQAIASYNKIVGGDKALTQTAYYQLGHAYLQYEQKNEAVNAFRSASELRFNKEITKDALYNYAKISFENGNTYETVAESLGRYLSTYPEPKDEKYEEIYQYLIASYDQVEDMKTAYTFLKDKLIKENASLRPLQAQIGYNYGIRAYKKTDYRLAEEILTEVAFLKDATYSNKSLYWKAQSQYKQARYKDAINSFETLAKIDRGVQGEDKLAYSLAYAYFQVQDYPQAIRYFSDCIAQNTSQTYKDDAQIRLADSYYAQADFKQAREAYRQVVENNTSESEYALFQEAMIYGLVNELEEKRNHLLSFLKGYEQSSYSDDAMYQLADTYFKLGDSISALKDFTAMQNAYPTSEWVPYAELKKAQVYYNQNDLDQALASYQNIVVNFPASTVAQEAVVATQKIYESKGEIEAYETWIQQFGIAVDQDELARMSFEAAEKKFYLKDYTQALNFFKKFINKYPTSVNLAKAHYYAGESAYQNTDKAQALQHFEACKKQNIHQEKVYLRLAQIYTALEQRDQALEALLQLEEITENDKYRVFSQAGIVKIYLQQSKTEEAYPYAMKIEKASQASQNAKEEAQLVIARHALSEDVQQAYGYYKTLQKAEDSSIRAEAVYYEALNLSDQKKYEASNDLLFAIASQYGSVAPEWAAKGLLVMSDNYRSINDPYQANYALEVLIKTYPKQAESIEKAKEKKENIK